MKNKIQVAINLLDRNTDELIQSNINLDELIEMYENQKNDFHEKYSVDVEIEFDGYEYNIEDYNSEYFNEPLNKIANISKYGNKLEDIEHMYHTCARQDEIDELYSVQNNELKTFYNGSIQKRKQGNIWKTMNIMNMMNIVTMNIQRD